MFDFNHPDRSSFRIADLVSMAAQNPECQWPRIHALYRQYGELAGHPHTDETRRQDLHAAMAEALGEASLHVSPDQLIMGALATFADVDHHDSLDRTTARALYQDPRFTASPTPADLLPSPAESVIETGRRLRDAQSVRTVMADTPTTGIQCGSVSLGPYFSVRGGRRTAPASDLDMIIVYADDTLVDVADQLLGVPGASTDDVHRLISRTKIFKRFDDDQTVLSHKLHMWRNAPDPLYPMALGAEYGLSIHFISNSLLEYIVVDSSDHLTVTEAAARRPIRDYRNTPTDRPDVLYSFTGHPTEFDPQLTTVDQGYFRRTSVYVITRDDRYHPGFYHTVTQPELDLLWDSDNVANRYRPLQQKLRERYRYERDRDPYTLMRPSLAHVRLPRLAPHMIAAIDDTYLN